MQTACRTDLDVSSRGVIIVPTNTFNAACSFSKISVNGNHRIEAGILRAPEEIKNEKEEGRSSANIMIVDGVESVT